MNATTQREFRDTVEALDKTTRCVEQMRRRLTGKRGYKDENGKTKFKDALNDPEREERIQMALVMLQEDTKDMLADLREAIND